MKKIILALCTLASGSVFAAPTTQTGTIHLNGKIYSATCDIEVNGDPFAENVNIDMGRHPSSAFNSKGDEIGYNGVNGLIDIQLSNYPENGKLSVSFTGTTLNGDPTILQLDNPGAAETAKNIGIRLYEAGIDNKVRMDGSVSFEADVTDSETYTKDFYATYISTADSVSPGNANATLGFEIEYN